MTRTIPVVDLTRGCLLHRPSTTQTFDVPADFDRATAGVELDDKSRAHYSTTDGKRVVREFHPRPLSWRVRGEVCLIAEGDRRATPERPNVYKLYSVES